MVTQATAPDQVSATAQEAGASPSHPGPSHPGIARTGFGLRSLHAIARRVRHLQGSLLAPSATRDLATGDADGLPALQRAEAWCGTGTCFERLPTVREAPDAYRIAYAGQLSPSSGVADFLLCATLWADQNPSRRLELCWIGEGDLRGVLLAQPLPANLAQKFTGALAPDEMAGQFGRSGILVVPSLVRAWPPYLVEAMAAGLVVLGSSRNPAVRSLVVPRQTGWLFDPFSTTSMLDTLDAALAASPGQLDTMRAAARARIGVLHAGMPAHGGGSAPATMGCPI